MKKQTKVKETTLREWCDGLVADGKELRLRWDGGNDSGCVDLEWDDGVLPHNPEASTIIDMCYRVLDYGSWAGDFSASGYAEYDKVTHSFRGENEEYVSEDTSFDCTVSIVIPTDIHFNSVIIAVEVYEQGSPHAEVTFNITNGFITDYARKIERKIEQSIKDYCGSIQESLKDGSEINDTIVLEKEEFTKSKGNLSFTIKSLSGTRRESVSRDILVPIE